jgi:hypothetical protein
LWEGKRGRVTGGEGREWERSASGHIYEGGRGHVSAGLPSCDDKGNSRVLRVGDRYRTVRGRGLVLKSRKKATAKAARAQGETLVRSAARTWIVMPG